MKAGTKRAIAMGCTLLAAGIYSEENLLIRTTLYDADIPGLPAAFEGFRIAHLSDLHNRWFGKDQKQIQRTLQNAKPDMIALTGDFIDCHTRGMIAVLPVLRHAAAIAPTVFVTGNHDEWSPWLPQLDDELAALGIEHLNGTEKRFVRNGAVLRVFGLDCRNEVRGTLFLDYPDKRPDVLVTHTPFCFDAAAMRGVPLTLCGHMHSGQIALPGGKPILGPGFSVFPHYSCGVYQQGASKMIINRGLGTSNLPLRLFAHPEICVITLHCVN